MQRSKKYSIAATIIATAFFLTACGSIGLFESAVTAENIKETPLESAVVATEEETSAMQIDTKESDVETADNSENATDAEAAGESQPASTDANQSQTATQDSASSEKEKESEKTSVSATSDITAGSSGSSDGGSTSSGTQNQPADNTNAEAGGTSSSPGVIGVIGSGTSQDVHIHIYSRQVVSPTCSQQGYTVFTCSCGESYTGDYTSATGQHRWVPDYEEVPVYEKRGIHVCNVCGKDITDMTLGDHYFNDGCLGSWRSVIIQEQVGTKTAIVSYHCGDCGTEW